MPTKRPPKETNQLAKYILEVTTGETEKIEPKEKEKKQTKRHSSQTKHQNAPKPIQHR